MNTPLADVLTGPPILLHTAVRWDQLRRRTRQAILRVARGCDVLVVEAPLFLDDLRRPALATPGSGAPGSGAPGSGTPIPTPGDVHARIRRIVPRLPAAYRESERVALLTVRTLLLDLLSLGGALAHRFEAPVHWFCTPVPAPAMVGAFGERVVVYDCAASPLPVAPTAADVAQCERWLRTRADIVFAAGRSTAEMLRLLEAAIAGREGGHPRPARR